MSTSRGADTAAAAVLSAAEGRAADPWAVESWALVELDSFLDADWPRACRLGLLIRLDATPEFAVREALSGRLAAEEPQPGCVPTPASSA